MAIEGPLRELALTDVIQLLHLSRKTGTLSVGADRAPRPGLIHFDQGAVVGARPAGEGSRLGHLLVMAGRATEGQVDAALELQRRVPVRRIGVLLAETQGVPAVEVQRQLRFQIEEAVFDLVRWRDGYFRFEESTPPASEPIAVRVAAESLLMESMRRTDEWMEMASGEPDASLVPVLVERQADPGAILSLQPGEWQVLAAVDGERTLREIAREIGRGEFEVAKAVYGLASGGVVELRTRGAQGDGPVPAAPGVEEGRAAVEAALVAGRLDEANARVDALARAHPQAAEVDLLRGRVLERAGRGGEAVEAYARAVARDPLLGAGYYHLGLAAARSGDLERAQECLATFARLPESDPGEMAVARRISALSAELRRILEETR